VVAVEGNISSAAMRGALAPPRSLNPSRIKKACAGTWDISCLTGRCEPDRLALGRLGAVANDEGAREVTQRRPAIGPA
jgi:hypothetical protein